MTTAPVSERQSDDHERLDAIRDRITVVRSQTQQLVDWASEAATHSREARSRHQQSCSHAQQATEMQAVLDEVQRELEGLRVAMHTRSVIEQAKGMLMLDRHVDGDTAFDLLVGLSQRSHRKLVEVAQALVDSWSTGDRAHA